MADFDGICGEKTLTLSVKEDADPRYLAFAFHSDRFVEFATRSRIGSTNPHIRWRDVAQFELSLPSLEEQKRIAEILAIVSGAEDRYGALARSVGEYADAFSRETFSTLLQNGVPLVPLASICSRTPHSGVYKGPEWMGRGTNTVHMRELFGYDVIDRTVSGLQRMELSETELTKYSLTSADLLFGRRSLVLEGAGKCAMVGDLDEPTAFESSLLRVTTAGWLYPALFLNG